MDKRPFHKDENDKNFDNKEDEDDGDFSPLSAPTDLTNEGQLITNFKRSGDNSETSKDEAFSYLQEIAKTPLLTPKIEKELFAEFGNQRKEVTRLLECFPDSILENSKPKVNRRRCNKDGLTGVEAWWTPMNISVVIENMEKEIRSYKLRMYGDLVPSLEGIEVNDEIEDDFITKPILEKLWVELNRAVSHVQETKNAIVQANLLLVASIAKQHNHSKSALTFLDLMQEGSIGLMKAVEKFDLSRGFRFSTYATWWIMQAIKRALDQQSQTIRIPCYVGETRRTIEATRAKLARELEREPSNEEIADRLGNIDVERLTEIVQSTRRTVSLDSPLSEASPDATISDLLADEDQSSPEDELLVNADKESLERVLNTLTEREKLVVQLRYGLRDGSEYTLAEIGRRLGISRERVRQIEDEALRKLRHPTRESLLKEIL
jgi:RNA polymerase sigma factor (sigma-70 family)